MESRLLKKRIPSDPDLTSGSIVDKVLLFAIPLMLTSMLQQLFNATDIAVVGKFAYFGWCKCADLSENRSERT